MKIVIESRVLVDDIASTVRHVLFALALVGCAKGGVGQLAQGDANEIVIDGTVYKDAPDNEHDDAHVYMDAKQFEDAHEFHDAHVYTDAHVYMDAHVFMDACTMVQTELLTNGNFDSGPNVGWHEVQQEGEIILTNFPQAGTYHAWMGGYDNITAGGHGVDELFEDVAVPAGTTALVINGYYEVATQEPDLTMFDTSSMSLVNPVGETPIETGLSLSEFNNSGAYVAFTHSFAVAGVAGTTVRVKLTSSNDSIYNTNFFYDTLSLKATHCI